MDILHSGFQNFKKWLHNPRYWIVAVILGVFSNNVSNAFQNLATISGTRLSIWLFPFLLYDRYLQFCIALCLIMVFCDAPFLDNLQPYALQRIGRRKWFFGQQIYMLACSILFFLYIWLCLVILAGDAISFSCDWGSCLEMLAHDNPFWGTFAPDIILEQKAIPTHFRTFAMSCMVGFAVGNFLMFLNLRFKRETGALIAGSLSVLDFFFYSYFDQLPALFWISPISWINPQQYTGSNQWKWDIRICMLVISIIILGLSSLRTLYKANIETTPEI